MFIHLTNHLFMLQSYHNIPSKTIILSTKTNNKHSNISYLLAVKQQAQPQITLAFRNKETTHYDLVGFFGSLRQNPKSILT